MEIRGERECRDCGTRWSYYETGSVHCPDCGSLLSVGIDEPTRHTDSPVELDLVTARTTAADGSIREAAEEAGNAARAYLRRRGFIHAGELRPLDDVYVAVEELKHVASTIGHRISVDDSERSYFIELLNGAPSGRRPDPGAVPDSLRTGRGLGAASAVRTYRDELRSLAESREVDDPVRALLDRLDGNARRIRAMDGDVDPADADRLVTAARAIGAALGDEPDGTLTAAESALDALETSTGSLTRRGDTPR
ncbi:MAG: DUF7117 family protein [Halodesulfurarchaeum sp.]